jgi:choline-sulfatase
MSVMSALSPEETGVFGNEAHWEACAYQPRPVLFPEVFAKHGYATANFGKMHLPQGLQPWGLHKKEGASQSEVRAHMAHEGVVRAPGVGMVVAGRFNPGVTFPGERVTDNALKWMAEQEHPFLVRLGFLQPHTPVCPPPPFDTLYPPQRFPAAFPDDAGTSIFERRFGEACGGRGLEGAELQQAQAHYFGLAAWIDTQVGRVLAWLKASGREQRTLVVFDADHGAVKGEGGGFGKHIFAPWVHRIPRLISWPGTLPAGTARADLCTGLDLARTLLGAADTAAPSAFQGRDLFSSSEPDAVYGTIGYGLPWSRAFPNRIHGAWAGGRGWPRRACVRTRQYRLDMTVRQDGCEVRPEERDVFLADSLADPDERINLAADPEHAEVRDTLISLLVARTRNSREDACRFDEERVARIIGAGQE